MKASVVDLRYRMNDVLKALERNEEVSILYHGKVKGIIRAAGGKIMGRTAEHPFFRMHASRRSVNDEMNDLRGDRYRAL